jgi:hypothetical protein
MQFRHEAALWHVDHTAKKDNSICYERHLIW